MELNKEHFKDFVECCEHYQKLLGLFDFAIRYTFEDVPPSDGKMTVASTLSCEINRNARIRLNKNWVQNEPPTYAVLKKAALHEMLEVLMGDVRRDMLHTFSWMHVDSKIHRVIRSIEHAMLEDD